MFILFGSVTGTAENLAREAEKVAQARGHNTRLSELDEVSMDELSDMDDVLVFVSTYGEGEMPFNAETFWDEISDFDAPPLAGMNYGVLALGDTAYEQFCEAGKEIDARFAELGATRRVERVDCDLNYEETANDWIDKAIPVAGKMVKAPPAARARRVAAPTDPASQPRSWNRRNPFPTRVSENRLLSGEGSTKEMRHMVVELGDSGMQYEAGDCIGVIPRNAPALVDAYLERLQVPRGMKIDGFDKPLVDLLTHQFELVTPPMDLLRGLAAVADDDALAEAINDGSRAVLEAYLWNKDTLDLLNLNRDLDFDPALILRVLKPLQYRAYSIASSPKAHPKQVHLTVGTLRWQNQGRDHGGVCSTYLADQTGPGQKVGIFIIQNKHFRVPSDPDADMIMVGPGTGIAPFLAFLQERQATGAKGHNWLIFGDRNRACDHVYSDELDAFTKDGCLHRLDLAFSRDQDEKDYVQHRMLDNADTLFAALEDGAHFYVCGDASRMAKDVDEALHKVIEIGGGKTRDEAKVYVGRLKKDRRYFKDVY